MRTPWRRNTLALLAGAVAVLALAAVVAIACGSMPVALSCVALAIPLLGVMLVGVRRSLSRARAEVRLLSGSVSALASVVAATHVEIVDLQRRSQDHSETTARRLLSVESMAAELERHHDRLSSIEESVRSLDNARAADFSQTGRNILQAMHHIESTVEGVVQLYTATSLRAPMPPSGDWALDVQPLLRVLDLLKVSAATNVLELGSGTSTLWIAYALERSGGHLTSIDHSEVYGGRTRAELERHQLLSVAEVRLAPLRPLTLAGGMWNWYDPTVFDDLSDIDMLLVDGPPGNTGPLSRLPALGVLATRLSPGAFVVLDDAQRPDEIATVEHWLKDFPDFVLMEGVAPTLAVLRRAGPYATENGC